MVTTLKPTFDAYYGLTQTTPSINGGDDNNTIIIILVVVVIIVLAVVAYKITENGDLKEIIRELKS